jgi:hypothetical protein
LDLSAVKTGSVASALIVASSKGHLPIEPRRLRMKIADCGDESLTGSTADYPSAAFRQISGFRP